MAVNMDFRTLTKFFYSVFIVSELLPTYVFNFYSIHSQQFCNIAVNLVKLCKIAPKWTSAAFSGSMENGRRGGDVSCALSLRFMEEEIFNIYVCLSSRFLHLWWGMSTDYQELSHLFTRVSNVQYTWFLSVRSVICC